MSCFTACDLRPGFASRVCRRPWPATGPSCQRREGAAADPITAACRVTSSSSVTAVAWHQCGRRVGKHVCGSVARRGGGRQETVEEGACGGVPFNTKQWTHITTMLTREGRNSIIRLETVTHAAHKLHQGLECDQKREKKGVPAATEQSRGQCSAIGPPRMAHTCKPCAEVREAGSSQLRLLITTTAQVAVPLARGQQATCVYVRTQQAWREGGDRKGHTAAAKPHTGTHGRQATSEKRSCVTQGSAANAAKPEPGARNNLRTVGMCLLSGPLPLCFK